MKIIIIDDDPLVVQSLKTIVSVSGIEVLAVGYDGYEAIELYQKYAPDLILMDILLLVADGLNNKEIAKRLFLSEGTVRNYISNLLEKLALRDRTQLAIYYYKMKLNCNLSDKKESD